MNASQFEEIYGTEYPDAVTTFGIRMPLVKEQRFARFYASVEPKFSTEVSRFLDGGALITLAELRDGWEGWAKEDRRDFCSSCSALHEHQDFADMLRFVMKSGNEDNWSSIASLVSYALPMEEAFSILKAALDRGISLESNLIQAIALTKHPRAKPVLRKHLAGLWARTNLWADDSFLNYSAADAVNCIQCLLELGDKPGNYEDKVRALAEHVCARNRDSCRRWLHQYYGWLPEPPPWQPPGSRESLR